MDYIYTRDGRLRAWETFRRVTPQELYSYWTDPAKLKMWWPDEVTIDAVPGGHYSYTFTQPGQTLTGVFSEVLPGRRLAFSWEWAHEPGSARQVVVDFEKRDADTLLTVTHGTYGGSEAEAREREEHLEGWQHSLGRLKRVIRPT